MRFAIVVDPFDKVHGGIEYQAFRLCGALRSLGHHVDVVEPRAAGVAMRRGYDWLFFEGIRRPALLSYLANKRRSGRTRFCLATHGSFFTRTHVRELSLLGYHSNLSEPLKTAFDRVLMARILQSMNLLIVLSDAEAIDVHRLFGVPLEIIYPMPHLIPDPKLSSGSPIIDGSSSLSETGKQRCLHQDVLTHHSKSTVRPDSIEALGGPSPYFVTISRIDRRKNVIASVRAASLAGVRLFVAGQDGGELTNVLREIGRTSPSTTRYLGTIPEADKTRLLTGAVALVIPSYFEGLPAVSLEARCLGTRVISTRLSYAPPMDEVYLCDPTPKAIADQMRSLMQLQARAVPLALPTESQVVARYVELFSTL